MNRNSWSRAVASAAVSLVMALSAGSVQADSGDDDGLSLKMAAALRKERLFVRAGVIFVKIKTKSGQTYDVTGPVMTTSEIENVFYNDILPGTTPEELISKYPNVNFNYPGVVDSNVLYELFVRNGDPDPATGVPYNGTLLSPLYGLPLLTTYLRSQGLNGIGTPPGILGIASPETGTAGISLGYYLDDDHKWVVETYILAAPLSTGVTIRGTTNYMGLGQNRPISIDGTKIIKTKLLPPALMFGRYFGAKGAKFRPFLGAMAMYAMFFDTKATDALNNYVGGSNPGDTTVAIKNTFGIGPMLGLKYQFNDTWHASFNLGLVKLKTNATLTTRNTHIRSDNPILQDLGGISEKIGTGEGVYTAPNCNDITCTVVKQNDGLATLISKGVAADRGDRNLGTFVRKTNTELTNTLFMLSVGRSF